MKFKLIDPAEREIVPDTCFPEKRTEKDKSCNFAWALLGQMVAARRVIVPFAKAE
jgi:hypothetical protein